MGLLDKAKGLADQAMTKADEALGGSRGRNRGTTMPTSRDLGVLAYLDSVGRAAPDADEQGKRCLTSLGQLEAQGPLDLTMGSMAPPPPSATANRRRPELQRQRPLRPALRRLRRRPVPRRLRRPLARRLRLRRRPHRRPGALRRPRRPAAADGAPPGPRPGGSPRPAMIVWSGSTRSP